MWHKVVLVTRAPRRASKTVNLNAAENAPFLGSLWAYNEVRTYSSAPL